MLQWVYDVWTRSRIAGALKKVKSFWGEGAVLSIWRNWEFRKAGFGIRHSAFGKVKRKGGDATRVWACIEGGAL